MCLRRIRGTICRFIRTWPGVSLTKLNQLWVADITFIRLRSEFVYQAVVLDAYSRRVIGWDLGRTLQAELAIRALQMALNERNWKAEELIHHSDRGVQYASSDYTEILEQREIQISMSRRGKPTDNPYVAYCTSLDDCGKNRFEAARSWSLMPCCFQGGLSSGS